MQAATDSARNIRADIQDIRNKYECIIAAVASAHLYSSLSSPPPFFPRCVMVHSNTKCQVCNGHLLSHGFYIFPCTHAFHRDCLITEVGVVSVIVAK